MCTVSVRAPPVGVGAGALRRLGVVPLSSRRESLAEPRELLLQPILGLLLLVPPALRRPLPPLEILPHLPPLGILRLVPLPRRLPRLREVLQSRPRLRIQQDVVRLLKLVELLLRALPLRVLTLVGVQLQGQLSIRLLDLGIGQVGLGIYAQDPVRVNLRHVLHRDGTLGVDRPAHWPSSPPPPPGRRQSGSSCERNSRLGRPSFSSGADACAGQSKGSKGGPLSTRRRFIAHHRSCRAGALERVVIGQENCLSTNRCRPS